jgi:hypothetical protein
VLSADLNPPELVLMLLLVERNLLSEFKKASAETAVFVDSINSDGATL